MSKIAKFGCEMWSNAENIALQSLQILYTFVLRVEIATIVTIFGPNVVAISTRNTKVYEICKAIFSALYNISQPNFAIILILVCSFREYTFFAKIKNQSIMGIVYYAHFPLRYFAAAGEKF
jgi:hypothetical protein